MELLVLLFVALTVVSWAKHRKRCRLAEEAMNEFYDLYDWIIEHINDPFMSDQKWRELLPIYHFADERFCTHCRPLEFQNSCEALVLRIIGREEEVSQ